MGQPRWVRDSASRSRILISRASSPHNTGDVLVAWKLDRLGRNLAHLVNTVQDLADDGRPSDAYPSDHRRHGARVPGCACDAGGLVSNTGALPRNHRSSCPATSPAAGLRNAHSQTIPTRQPAWSRSRRLRRSRSVFASNLARQNLSRVVGVVVYWQPTCRCQKQPCTKHTATNRGNTRSGVPGSFRSCRRYRSPRA